MRVALADAAACRDGRGAAKAPQRQANSRQASAPSGAQAAQAAARRLPPGYQRGSREATHSRLAYTRAIQHCCRPLLSLVMPRKPPPSSSLPAPPAGAALPAGPPARLRGGLAPLPCSPVAPAPAAPAAGGSRCSPPTTPQAGARRPPTANDLTASTMAGRLWERSSRAVCSSVYSCKQVAAGGAGNGGSNLITGPGHAPGWMRAAARPYSRRSGGAQQAWRPRRRSGRSGQRHGGRGAGAHPQREAQLDAGGAQPGIQPALQAQQVQAAPGLRQAGEGEGKQGWRPM